MASTPSPRPHYPSIRSSCDRCRAKKLACVVSAERTASGARQCVRCRRAEACCVFGPRAQTTRRKTTAPRPSNGERPRPLAQAAAAATNASAGPRPHDACCLVPLPTPPPPPPPSSSSSAPAGDPEPGAVGAFPCGVAFFPSGLPGGGVPPAASWFDGFITGGAGECCGIGFDIHNFCHEDALVLDPFLDPCPLWDFAESPVMAPWAPMDSWEYRGGLQLPQAAANQQPWIDGVYNPCKLGVEGGGANC